MVKFSLHIESPEAGGPMKSLSSTRLSLFPLVSPTFFMGFVD